MPDHRTEQPHQRADRSDRAERRQVAIQIVRHGSAGLLDRLLHDFSRELTLRRPAESTRPERRMALQFFQQLVVVGAALELADRTLQQAGWHNLGATQGDQTLDNQRNGNDGGQQQRPDWPTSRLNNREHGESSLEIITHILPFPRFTASPVNRALRRLSPKSVDKSVNRMSSTSLNPSAKAFPALPKNEAYCLIR
jgi:hypothetical protein